MSEATKLGFSGFAAPAKGVLIVFCDDKLAFGGSTKRLLGAAADLVKRAAAMDRFTGKSGAALDIVAPAGLEASRLVVIGIGKAKGLKALDIVKLGGKAVGKVPQTATEITIVADLPSGAMKPDQAADLALGAELRTYAFERYKTKRKEGEEKSALAKLTMAVGDVAAARKAWQARAAVGEGTVIARDLVNEPANILYPEEFARRTTALKKHGVAVEVLDVKAMQKLGMGALLGVGQGSAHDSRLSPSSVRACASTPVAFPSSRQPAWRT
jgi:leucyl aminopeptidase